MVENEYAYFTQTNTILIRKGGCAIFSLIAVLLLVLLLPFLSKTIERNLEVFLLCCGILAGVISDVFDRALLSTLFISPLAITFAVFIAGMLFRVFQKPIEKAIQSFSQKMPLRLFLAITVVLLGLLSSIITAIIAAILLVTIAKAIHINRQAEIRFVIIACFSIGMGAVLTPIGEPLSTIATNKLNEEFFFLFKLLGTTIIPSLLLLGLLAAFLIRPQKSVPQINRKSQQESMFAIFIRSFKIYLFVMALTLLGVSFEPFIERYLLDLHPLVLYWLNMTSAILDNATLAAAEISPQMSDITIRAILLGLLISGGMLIPGNIPNIIAANQLKMTSKEWARFGLPFGLLLMGVYFLVIVLIQ